MNRKLVLLVAFCLLACSESAKQAQRYPLSPSEVLAQSKPDDWRLPDPRNLVYLQLKSGLVIFELAPQFAPNHVRNIKSIVAAKYWDGLSVIRAQDNYVVQWGDGQEVKKEFLRTHSNSISPRLAPEFERDLGLESAVVSTHDRDVYAPEVGFVNGFPVGLDRSDQSMWLLHCYGVVGVSRGEDPRSGNGTSLYVVIGHAPRHLDRNITLVGKVLYGMEHLSTLPRGKDNLGFYKDKKSYHPIKDVKMGNTVPPNQRVKLKVLKTDTELFKKLLAARKNRSEKWFLHPAGHLDVCNARVDVRVGDKE